MRILVIVCLALAPFAPLLSAQTESMDDPYSLGLIRFELKMNSQGRRVIHSWSQKRLFQLGDGVSVALLKILEPDELKSPDNVKAYMPLIQASFAEPQAVLLEENKDPKVTLFLIGYLRQNIPDPEVQALILKTEEFVLQKTANKR